MIACNGTLDFDDTREKVRLFGENAFLIEEISQPPEWVGNHMYRDELSGCPLFLRVRRQSDDCAAVAAHTPGFALTIHRDAVSE